MFNPESFSLAQEAASPRFVSSRRALARELGCSERLISIMDLEEGCPRTRANGSYDVEKWKNFYADRKSRMDADDTQLDENGNPYSMNLAIKQATLEERQTKAQLAKIQLAEKRGELVSMKAARTAIAEFTAKLKSLHEHHCDTELAEKIAKELTLPDKELEKIRELLSAFHEEFCESVAKLAPNSPTEPNSAS